MATYDLLITNGTVVTDHSVFPADVGIRDGRIVEIGELEHDADEIFDASGLHILPGLIDTQVHFREPGLEHKEDLESGTRAAILGGVTGILEMPNTNPTTTSADALADKVRRATGRAWCDFGFFVGASTDNLDELANLETLPGSAGIKMFMGSSTGTLLVDDDADVLRVLQNGRYPMPVHAEDEARNRAMKSLLGDHPDVSMHPVVRDAESAVLATTRLLRMSQQTGRPVHVLHISTAQEPTLIAEAKAVGINVTAEVTPQHLWFSADDYARLGTHLQMNPPIRSAEHREALWVALAGGVFDVFGSDHAPHTLEEKAKPYPHSPSGMPGVQTMLPVLLTYVAQGRLALTDIARMGAKKPAELYGMRGKGQIQAGFDADLAFVDLNDTYTFERSMVASKCGWSPYEGESFTGRCVHVLLGGKWAVRGGELQGTPSGRVIEFHAR